MGLARLDSINFIQRRIAGYHKINDSVGPLTDINNKVGFFRRTAIGLFKATDLFLTLSLDLKGTYLERWRIGLFYKKSCPITPSLLGLYNEVNHFSGYTPKFSMPPANPRAVSYIKGEKVWMTEGTIDILWGLYTIGEDKEGNPAIGVTRKGVYPVNEEIREKLAPVKNLQKEAVERLPRSKGWKLHLNFDYKNNQVVKKIRVMLEELEFYGIIVGVKIGDGGGKKAGAPGKEATVYIGHGWIARKVAEYLQDNYSDILLPPEGDTLEDDMILTPLVAGRFDINHIDRYHQYGSDGVPFRRSDMDKFRHQYWHLDKDTMQEKIEQIREENYKWLERVYGEFFTAGFVGSERPKVSSS